MTERVYRIFLGSSLLLLLYVGNPKLIYAYIGFLIFEGVTNLRGPILISRLRYGADYQKDLGFENVTCKTTFEAERALRLVASVLVLVPYAFFARPLWYVPWFVGIALTVAGITGICPMYMLLSKIGFKR